MKVLAIDPGSTKSGYCVIDADTLKPLDFGKIPNESLYEYIQNTIFEEEDRAVIETMKSTGGLKVKMDYVFTTCIWIGRYYEQMRRKLISSPGLITRIEEKQHILGKIAGNDAAIKTALVHRFARHDFKDGKGTKKNPDWFYGFAKDVWQAYAVGLTYIETRLAIERS